MLKKVIFLLVSVFFVSGCFSQKEPSGKLRVLSTTAQIGDLVSFIGGDHVDSRVLIRGELDPHSYEIVKGDGEKLLRAQIIFYNGLGLEHGASLSSFLEGTDKAVAIGDYIIGRAPDKIILKDGALDPHIWMDISLWKEGVALIVEKLSQIDPEYSFEYKERGSELLSRMELADAAIAEHLQSVPEQRRYLVTSHDAFSYFTRRYLSVDGEENWQERFAAPEGLAPEGQLNPKDIQKILTYLQEKKISVIFPESNVNRDSLRKIFGAGKEMGLEIRICKKPLYGDAMGDLSYLDMMKSNADTLVGHL